MADGSLLGLSFTTMPITWARSSALFLAQPTRVPPAFTMRVLRTRDAVHEELYWYMYEMLKPPTAERASEQVVIQSEIIHSAAHVMRKSELILQHGRGDAQICGIVALEPGLRQSGDSSKSNDIEIIGMQAQGT
jgi:hypothetical protein